ncbi:MAG: right-handed parallel beta-helix repeat-containing protein, partial [Candidatus Thorarchaeota archaeon]
MKILRYAAICLMVTFLLFTTSGTLYGDIESMPSSSARRSDGHLVRTAEYIVNDSISISSDSDFRSQGWPGNGTIDNPYILEGYAINASQSLSGICLSIEDTRSFFIVKDCFFHLGEYGVQLDNVTNGRIEHNEFDELEFGVILISGSNHNTIDSNTLVGRISSNSRNGINIHKADFVTISNNTVTGYWLWGIYLNGNKNNTISSNTMLGTVSINVGIWMRDVSNATLFNNTCIDTDTGIYLDASSSFPSGRCVNNVFLNNTCTGAGWGISLGRCNSSIIMNNNASNNDVGGIGISESMGSILIDNYCLYNGQRGIALGDTVE